jgi:hypothetical protein
MNGAGGYQFLLLFTYEDAKTAAGIANEGYGSRSQPFMQK